MHRATPITGTLSRLRIFLVVRCPVERSVSSVARYRLYSTVELSIEEKIYRGGEKIRDERFEEEEEKTAPLVGKEKCGGWGGKIGGSKWPME